MKSRLLFGLSVVALVVATLAPMALAASVTVHIGGGGGNAYYFNDSTPGDNQVTVNPGDTITFVVDDNGGNQAHTVEVDAFGWHSGSLAKGGTYTVTVPNQPGQYTLYCRPHRPRGHVGTLVVLGDPVATTTTVSSSSTISTGSTATTVVAGDVTTTTRPGNAPEHASAGGKPITTTTPLSAAPEEPGSDAVALQVDLEPWTRSVRLALLGLLPVAGLALVAGLLHKRRADSPPSQES